jgi:hypothetical protein
MLHAVASLAIIILMPPEVSFTVVIFFIKFAPEMPQKMKCCNVDMSTVACTPQKYLDRHMAIVMSDTCTIIVL